LGTHLKSLLQRASVMLVIGAVSVPALAQSATGTNEVEDDFDELLDEVEIDVQGSLDDTDDVLGFRLNGDLRLGYIFDGEDIQDVTFGETDVLRARWRIRSSWQLQPGLRARVRVAGLCSTEDCEPDFILQRNLPSPASIEDGQVTIDSMYVEWFKRDRFDVALGRMEAKFVARGGVYAKSLDRNDSNNLRVNWTDGLHSTFKAKNGWESHLIVQYNDKDGPSNVRRSPLDFSSSKSRRSYFMAFQSLEPRRRLIQRGFDVSYLPASLAVDGPGGARHEDYWGLVGRAAFRWPVRSDSWRLRMSSELGYAPTTQTQQEAGIVGSGDADGLAWNITASIMDFLPSHSIGINFARTGAGWLLSPQYADNEELFEIRYMWRPTDRLTLDVRGRWRDELTEMMIDDPNRDRFDFYARFTWSFRIID
jgi:hypothetical protein